MKPGDKAIWWAPLNAACNLPVECVITTVDHNRATAVVEWRKIINGVLVPIQATVGLNRVTPRLGPR